MKAAKVHGIMKDALGPWFEGHGYAQHGPTAFWHKRCGSVHILIWIKFDRYGYDSAVGGNLMLDCCSGKEVTKDLQTGEFVPATEVCSDAQLRAWFTVKRGVLDKVLRKPQRGVAGALLREFIEDDKEEPYRKGSVAVMPYFDETDVRRWAELLLPVLPRLDREMEKRIARASPGKRRRTKRCT